LAWSEERLVHKDLELILVPDIGGRLMDVKYKGVSLLFQNPDLLSTVPDLSSLSELPSRAKHFAFPLWGGEKTWIAPDSDWLDGAPYPVLDSGRYTFKRHPQNSAELVSAVCPISGLQVIRVITITDENQWTVKHEVINKGSTPGMVGIWSVAMTQRPANYFFRTTPGVEPTTVFGEPLSAYSSTSGIGRVSCDVQQEFKLGCHPATGLSAAQLPMKIGDVWMINRVQEVHRAEAYAHGHALEFFNSGHYEYAELEWHSPVVPLEPGQSCRFDLDYEVVFDTNNLSADEIFELGN